MKIKRFRKKSENMCESEYVPLCEKNIYITYGFDLPCVLHRSEF